MSALFRWFLSAYYEFLLWRIIQKQINLTLSPLQYSE